MGKKKSGAQKRSRSRSPDSTPSVVRGDTPSDLDVKTPPQVASKGAKVADTLEGKTPKTSTAAEGATSGSVQVVPRRLIAVPGRVYKLSEIGKDTDFTDGVLRGRCTSVEVKSCTSKSSGKDFFVLEMVLTQDVSRLVTGYGVTKAQFGEIPEVGSFVQVTGVQVESARYDGCLYGDVQFATTPKFAVTIVPVKPDDIRIPKEWSTTNFLVKRAPAVSSEDFFD